MNLHDFPVAVLLHRSDTAYLHQLQRMLRNWQIEVYEVAVLAEIPDKSLLDAIPVAIAIADEKDISGLDFLRSVMNMNNWIQRILLTPDVDPEIYERAVNKAHINYLIPVPTEAVKLETYLRKAQKRYEQITRPFAKFDALTSITKDLLQENEKFRMEATTDPLTKLMNRRSFNQILERVWKRFKEKNIPFSIAMLDIDHFKKINDTHGHDIGDKIIIALSEILRTSTSHRDVVARFGGEEFCVVLKNINRYSAKDIFERIRLEIENFSFHIGHEVYIKFTVSIGLVVNSDDSLEEIINQADMMLYNAKNDGRNKLVFE